MIPFILCIFLLKTSVSNHFKNVHIQECLWSIVIIADLESSLIILTTRLSQAYMCWLSSFLNWIDHIVLIFCVFQVVLDFIQDIWNIILWDSGFYKNPLENVDFVVFFCMQSSWLNLDCKLCLALCGWWFQCQWFQSLCYGVWVYFVHVSLSLVWDLGGGLCHSAVVKVFAIVFYLCLPYIQRWTQNLCQGSFF